MATKKVIKSKSIQPQAEPEVEAVVAEVEIVDQPKATKVKRCLFCQSKSGPTYKDSTTLRKFLSDRTRILPKSRSGLCSKHQRQTAREIKRARFLSLLPYVTSV